MAVPGCAGGGSDDDRTAPPPEARAAVVAFVRDLADGDAATACAAATPDVVADLRESAAAGYRATASGDAARVAQVRAAHAKARTCAGAIDLLAAQVGRGRLDRLASRVDALPARWIGPDRSVVAFGDEDWDVVRDGDRWRISATNALADAMAG
jgi:hypothetical protein